MGKLKISFYDKLRKQMNKAIRHATARFLSPESLKDQEELTAKELKKKFPNSCRSTGCKKRLSSSKRKAASAKK